RNIAIKNRRTGWIFRYLYADLPPRLSAANNNQGRSIGSMLPHALPQHGIRSPSARCELLRVERGPLICGRGAPLVDVTDLQSLASCFHLEGRRTVREDDLNCPSRGGRIRV